MIHDGYRILKTIDKVNLMLSIPAPPSVTLDIFLCHSHGAGGIETLCQGKRDRS